MSHEFLRMQKLSGVITEGEYNQKIEELNSSKSSTETLNENVVGIGGISNPYPKTEEVYESAFSKFLGEEKDEMREEEEMREEKEEMDEMGMKYEEPTLKEDERTDTEEEGYKDGFKDAIKDAKDAIAKLRKDLKEEDEMEEGLTEDARTDAEEEGYQDGFKDAIKDALDALKGIKGELKEEEQLDEVPADRKGVKGYDTEVEDETEEEIDKMKARKPHKGKEDMGQFV